MTAVSTSAPVRDQNVHDDLAIFASGVTRDRGRFTLGPVDLAVNRGQVLALVGPNGSGKTTLIKALLGVVQPERGTLTVLGGVPGSLPGSVTAVLDTDYLVPDWTVPATAHAIAPFYERWSQDIFESIIIRLGVPIDAKVKDLSRGESSKLKLALALAPQPELLILDEPTSGLDPLAREQVLQVVREFMAVPERSVVFSTHISQDLTVLSNHIVILRQGQCVHSGSMAQLQEQYVAVQGAATVLQSALIETIGLRAYGDTHVCLVRAADLHRLPQGLASYRPSVDDVIKAFAVPVMDPTSKNLLGSLKLSLRNAGGASPFSVPSVGGSE